MKLTQTLLTAAALSCFAYSASAQSVRLTFDPGQTDYGAFEVSGVDTALTLTRTGGAIAANDFAELDDLTSETYTATGALLNPYNPLDFTITTTGGVANLDSSAFDVGGSGIDDAESISFVFDRSIIITEFDFTNIGTSEFASVTIAGSTQLFGDSSGDSHTGSFSLNAGQSLIFGFAAADGADYDLQAFTFTVVPEPGTYALLAGICALGYVMTRRRSAV